MRWDPSQYARYGDERSRPFHELVGRIAAAAPRVVTDVGCGTGELTATLSQRWPTARIRGIDSSPEMIARAPRAARTEFALGDAQSFDATGTDVVIANAVLQWVPHHLALLTRWSGQLPPGGWLAVQVPANFAAPSHRLMRELADSPAWHEPLAGVLRHADAVAEPSAYLDALATAGLTVDVWQTEYFHILGGEDPVLAWLRGSGLRPVLAALPGEAADRFSADYAELLREAYPGRPYGTVFGFRRTFVVAAKS